MIFFFRNNPAKQKGGGGWYLKELFLSSRNEEVASWREMGSSAVGAKIRGSQVLSEVSPRYLSRISGSSQGNRDDFLYCIYVYVKENRFFFLTTTYRKKATSWKGNEISSEDNSGSFGRCFLYKQLIMVSLLKKVY